MKKALRPLAAITLTAELLLSGCTQASRATRNISTEADNFNVTRRIVVINTITDTPILELVGNFSIKVDDKGQKLDVTVWRDYAENVAESLKKGMAVIVQGKLEQRSYEKDGQQRTAYQVAVDEAGPALRYARAQVVKAAQNASQPSTQADPYQGGQQAAWDNPGQDTAPF